MKKVLILILVVLLSLTIVSTVFAGGGPNGVWVRFDECDTTWKLTGDGVVHEWRADPDCMFRNYPATHIVFKPMDKFPTEDCEDDGYIYSFSYWRFSYQYDESFPGDEGDLDDFLTPNIDYHVCFYEWDHAEIVFP